MGTSLASAACPFNKLWHPASAHHQARATVELPGSDMRAGQVSLAHSCRNVADPLPGLLAGPMTAAASSPSDSPACGAAICACVQCMFLSRHHATLRLHHRYARSFTEEAHSVAIHPTGTMILVGGPRVFVCVCVCARVRMWACTCVRACMRVCCSWEDRTKSLHPPLLRPAGWLFGQAAADGSADGRPEDDQGTRHQGLQVRFVDWLDEH